MQHLKVVASDLSLKTCNLLFQHDLPWFQLALLRARVPLKGAVVVWLVRVSSVVLAPPPPLSHSMCAGGILRSPR